MSRGYIIELAEERDDGTELGYFQKRRVSAQGNLKMFVYADEHPPPHFHVIYNDEENSFRLDDATPLFPNGGLRKWFKNIKKWHGKNKQELYAAWNENRPTDCPVGPMSY